MSNKLNISGMLDFTEMDLTAPDQVVKEVLEQLPANTQNMIQGSIEKYDGHVTSYKSTATVLEQALGAMSSQTRVDIQDDLGKFGEEEYKYECYIYTSAYTKYKYRMFFMKYGVAHYPVQFTLEESIARSIHGTNSNYIITCNKREEVEALLLQILSSKKVLGVMQELIRICQAKRNMGMTIEEAAAIGNEDSNE